VETRIARLSELGAAPAASDHACVVQISGPSLGRMYELQGEGTIIGRDEGCGIVVELDTVSRRHCSLLLKPEGASVRDEGSKNGTWVNGVELTGEAALKSGDLIKIGAAIFKFLSGGEMGSIEAQYHEEIFRLTIIDGLTQLYNKRYLIDFIEREMARCARHGRVMSLAMIDLDNFKQINDGHGHSAGDSILRELGLLLRKRIRREECLARYGGEEFVAVLPEAPLLDATYFADMLRQRIGQHEFVCDGKRVPVTISAGVAQLAKEHASAEVFIKAADAMLYEAKRRGRNQVVSTP
jgi:two-component system cell cycle response regulator